MGNKMVQADLGTGTATSTCEVLGNKQSFTKLALISVTSLTHLRDISRSNLDQENGYLSCVKLQKDFPLQRDFVLSSGRD